MYVCVYIVYIYVNSEYTDICDSIYIYNVLMLYIDIIYMLIVNILLIYLYVYK